MTRPERRHDIDWLRVLAVLLLVPFHSALIFSFAPGDIVYVKDQMESRLLIQFAYFVHQWHMPLLFLLAGASTWFALGFRTTGRYLEERFLRLVVPTIFAITVLIPPMIYLQFLGKPDFGSFWQFYLQFFRIDFEDLSGYSGTFTPAHLWFVIFLCVFSVVALPLFLFLKHAPGRQLTARLAGFFKRRGAIFLPALPLALVALLPDIGGKSPFLYLTLFVYGYVLFSDVRFQEALDRHAVSALVLGVVATAPIAYLTAGGAWFGPPWGPVAVHVVYFFSRWCWLIAILGLGRRYLSADRGPLRALIRASYPFYTLHMPVNMAVAYFVVRWDASVAVKYTVINGVTLLATYAVYDLLVRRTPVTRFLFGVK
jgi:glucan biosynthesis protein C